MAVGGVQGEDLRQLGGQLAHPGRGGTDQELLGDLAEGEELLLDRGVFARGARRGVSGRELP